MNENMVEVNYTVFIEVKETGQVQQVQEKHLMRYLFLLSFLFLVDKN